MSRTTSPSFSGVACPLSANTGSTNAGVATAWTGAAGELLWIGRTAVRLTEDSAADLNTVGATAGLLEASGAAGVDEGGDGCALFHARRRGSTYGRGTLTSSIVVATRGGRFSTSIPWSRSAVGTSSPTSNVAVSSGSREKSSLALGHRAAPRGGSGPDFVMPMGKRGCRNGLHDKERRDRETVPASIATKMRHENEQQIKWSERDAASSPPRGKLAWKGKNCRYENVPA